MGGGIGCIMCNKNNPGNVDNNFNNEPSKNPEVNLNNLTEDNRIKTVPSSIIEVKKIIMDYASKINSNLPSELVEIKKTFEDKFGKPNNLCKINTLDTNFITERVNEIGVKNSSPNNQFNIHEIIHNKNPYADDINIDSKILKNYLNINMDECFYSPLIFTETGEIYDGFWNKELEKTGYGENISPTGAVYKGFFTKNKKDKYGAYIEKNGNYFIGEISNELPNGKGERKIPNVLLYKGDFKDDKFEGHGTLENYLDGSLYDGEMFNNKKHGTGNLKFIDGSIFNGSFAKDNFNYGKLKFNNGNSYEGNFENNKMNGSGKFIWNDGKIYEGEYKDDKKHGYGKLIWENGNYYEGNWVNNLQHGEGICYVDGESIKGIWRFGKLIIKKN